MHPKERSEDVMSKLLLASVNSATFSRTSNLNHSSARYERRKSLEKINNDPVWDLNDDGILLNDEEEGFGSAKTVGGELLDNEDSDIAGLNKEQQYIALNASPTKNKKFIKTLDSKRLHQDRIRRNSNEKQNLPDAMPKKSTAVEVISEPESSTASSMPKKSTAVEVISEPESSTASSTSIKTKNDEIVVKEQEEDKSALVKEGEDRGAVKEEEKTPPPPLSQEKGNGEKEEDKAVVVVVKEEETQEKKEQEDAVVVLAPSSSTNEDDTIHRGSTGDLEI